MQTLRDLEAVEVREVDVEQDDLWLELLRQPDGAGAVLGLADDVESFGLQQASRACAERREVIDYEDGLAHVTGCQV